jgi:predicted RNase H-like nuclease (RuvC/YqgF family)
MLYICHAHLLIYSFTLIVEDKTILQNQITAISASQHSSTSESTSLKERVEDTEREKRELVGVISRLKDETSQREGKRHHYLKYIIIAESSIEEIQTLRTNLKEARQEHQTLEARVRELRSIETSTKVSMSFCIRLIMKLKIYIVVQSRLPHTTTAAFTDRSRTYKSRPYRKDRGICQVSPNKAY